MNDQINESFTLLHMLGGTEQDVHAFFDQVWQISCAVYNVNVALPSGNDADSNDGKVDAQFDSLLVQQNPLKELIRQGWNVLVDLMDQHHRQRFHESQQWEDNAFQEECTPLLFHNQEIVDIKEQQSKYGHVRKHNDTIINLWAAFLDGCSVVLNHADLQSPWIAVMCEDIQKSLPHAYANVYITPAGLQTAPAHADDRDVFVIQVYGRKKWKVYQRIPIAYPYPHEQVGKTLQNPVPDDVMHGPILIERTLCPGDVLYMPRGYVHEAQSCEDCCSFHVTVAIATHDWTLAGLLMSANESIFLRQLEFRKAIDRQWGRSMAVDERVVNQVQGQLDDAIRMLREEVTTESIDMAMRNKYIRHNERAAAIRKPLIEFYASPKLSMSSSATRSVVVGRDAMKFVTMSSYVRAATEGEKAKIMNIRQPQKAQRGLHVREEIYDGIIEILQKLRQTDEKGMTHVRVKRLRSLISPEKMSPMICDLTLLSFVRRCVELGALALDTEP